MKIISFNAENFKRLVAVEITPTGHVVEIAGKNGAGKSSILDAIWVALSGQAAAPKQPIRKGELEARIVLTLGTDKPEIVVTRTFRPSKDGGDITSALKVESADGAKYSSPQAMLDKLLGTLTFDPLAFERMDARGQFNALRAFVPGFDFEAVEMAQRGDYDRRTHQNRIAKDKRAAALQIRVLTVSGEKVDESALVAQLEAAGKTNADVELRKANRESLRSKVDGLRKWIGENEVGISNLQKQIEEMQAKIAQLRQSNIERDKEATGIEERLNAAGPLPAIVDTADLRAQINAARDLNASLDVAARQTSARAAMLAEAQAAEQAANALTESIDMREVSKRKAIAEANLPVDGISFGDNEVLLRGFPFAQASDAERLVASMQIAMAMNPKLRIVRVRDGSLLDEDSMKIVAEMAVKNDHQVWIERVDGSGRVGVVIEDGRVKSSTPTKGETA